MSSKVYTSSSSSRMEATIRDLDISTLVQTSTHFVNPIWNNLSGKVVIINLPYNIDLSTLSKRNRLVLRFAVDLDIDYELQPFDTIPFEIKQGVQPYSDLILNKYMLLDPDYLVDDDTRYLLGTETDVNGYLTLTGYMIVKTIKA